LARRPKHVDATTIGIPDGASSASRVSVFSIEVCEGPQKGLKKVCDSGALTVGSGPLVDVRIADPSVSRFHCELEVIDERVRIRDHGSKNGTWISGVPVDSAWLLDGAVVHVGRSAFRFSASDKTAQLRLSERASFGDAVGASAAMRRIFADLAVVSEKSSSVLIEGETGTGKDVLAEAIHRNSPRADGPFVVVDCASLPAQLIESELFGHVRGAFTGAHSDYEGAVMAASGGTLLLDELGELPIDLQPKLLRMLEAQTVRPVGSSKTLSVDVRVIAATNRNLWRAVNERSFRDDLYYRLAVIRVRLPPLRERKDDLPLLIETLLRKLGALHTPEAAELLSPKGIESLCKHHWPGNVRELRNYVERYLAMGSAAPLEISDSDVPQLNADLALSEARERWTRVFERRYLQQVLEEHGGNVSAAARHAGVNRVHFYRLMSKTGLRE
jgi:DNA-binding NtrC family response regulator